MLSREMEAALNEQVNNEFYSAYLYLAMAGWFAERNLPGFARWMRVQFQEEQLHALRFFDFILARSGKTALRPIAAAPHEWGSPLAIFEFTLAHEREVTAAINRLVDLAVKQSDHASNAHLQWFVSEQVEEEASVEAVVQQLRLVGDAGHALFLIDRELGQRPQPAATPAASAGA